jgi:hypothetical protein
MLKNLDAELPLEVMRPNSNAREINPAKSRSHQKISAA